jgi:hypothetical protein
MPPYPLTREEAAGARALAEKLLVEKWLPSVTRFPDSYGVKGIPIEQPRLGEPFLDVTLRGRSLNDYLTSAEADPRSFASIVKYAFPIYVSSREEPLMSMIVMRNRDENGNKFNPEDGACSFFGYYFCGPGSITNAALSLRSRFGGRVSFVAFLDTEIERRVMIDDSVGVRSGVLTRSGTVDSLTTLVEDARRIKRYLRQ